MVIEHVFLYLKSDTRRIGIQDHLVKITCDTESVYVAPNGEFHVLILKPEDLVLNYQVLEENYVPDHH